MSGFETPSDIDTQQQQQQFDAEAKRNKTLNSYYYWHGHEKERARVGDVAPMPVPQLVKRTEEAVPTCATTYPITKYSWSDAQRTVTVYVDTRVDGQETMIDGTLQVEFKRRSLVVTYMTNLLSSKEANVRRTKRLQLHLSKAINASESSYKVKEASGQVVLRLVKEDSSSWWELVDKNANSGDDEGDDDNTVEKRADQESEVEDKND